MRDAITGLIGRYDQLGRYLDRSAIDRISTYYDESAVRLAAVELINREAAEIVREASQRLWRADPELLLPGGNAYTTRRWAACLRDMDYYLRLVTYGVVAGDVTPIEEIGIIGAREMYRALGTPLEAMAEAVREMKSVATGILTGADAEEAGFYFDYVVGALS